MLQWHKPSIDDFIHLKNVAEANSCFGCDMSSVNLILYASKYGTQICFSDGYFFRRYDEAEGVSYGWPLAENPEQDARTTHQKLQTALSVLKEEADSLKIPCLIYAAPKELPQIDIPYSTELHRDTADYLYLRTNLAGLAGSKYQKKRNHINQFLKKYPDARFEKFSEENICDALEVEKQWLSQSFTGTPSDTELYDEQELIKTALKNHKILGISGGIVYIENKPVAMCIASKITEKVTDVHFEKTLEPFARDGGYAFINRSFAEVAETEFLNREEDLGIEGLRKAKLSYHPDLLLEKNMVVLCSEAVV